MSVSVSYGQMIGYISATPFLHALLGWIGSNFSLYALDVNGNPATPYNVSAATSKSPFTAGITAYSSLTISASFSYPISQIYIYAPSTSPLVISFDYPILFATISFSSQQE